MTTNTLHDKIVKNLKRDIVAAQIVCPVTGNVLDARTAKFSADWDMLPVMAFDPVVNEAALFQAVHSPHHPQITGKTLSQFQRGEGLWS